MIRRETADGGDRSGRSLRVVIAPDSFKGSLDAEQVADALAAGWLAERPADDCITVPMADGGEGTLQVLAHASPGALRRTCRVHGPDGRPVDAQWLLLADGTAVVELACAAGLPQMAVLDAGGASTYGLGELLRAAAGEPATRALLVTLGGSATTDGGSGALVALGARLQGGSGRDVSSVVRGGLALSTVDSIDVSSMVATPPDGVVCLVDVTAPLLGPRGAAHQFGPQKGADAPLIDRLEAALGHWAEVLPGDKDAAGAGAAGGTAYGLCSGWGATLRPGAAALADLAGLNTALDDADVVLTGEGRFDRQSLGGKVVGHVLEQAARPGIAAAVVAGAVDEPPAGEWALVVLSELTGSVQASLADPGRWLTEAGRLLADEWPAGRWRS